MKDPTSWIKSWQDGSDGTDLHLNDTLDLYEVAARPIDGQLTDNAANQYPLQYCIEALHTYPILV